MIGTIKKYAAQMRRSNKGEKNKSDGWMEVEKRKRTKICVDEKSKLLLMKGIRIFYRNIRKIAVSR